MNQPVSSKINYSKLVDKAMHTIVKEALSMVVKNGCLVDEHHFFISFFTFYNKVKISKKLRERYPEEMTIILQHQFEDLQVKNDFFSVILSFDGVKEKIIVPYQALTAFADPSVKFGLQFKHLLEDTEIENIEDENAEEVTYQNDELDGEDAKTSSNVIDIRSFKKPLKNQG